MVCKYLQKWCVILNLLKVWVAVQVVAEFMPDVPGGGVRSSTLFVDASGSNVLNNMLVQLQCRFVCRLDKHPGGLDREHVIHIM
jgi:hypothetical protein